MAGVNKCLKYSMFVFNFLFWICGCVILGVSIWLRVSKNAQEEFNIQGMNSAIDLMIAVGSIIMVLGFFGCCGAVRESRCLLLLFFIGLFLILALQITAGVLGVVYKPKIEAEINKTMQGYLPLNNQPESFKDKLYTIQQENKCCGLVYGYKDWLNSIPQSCLCTQANDVNECVTVSGKLVYKQSCYTVFVDSLKNNMGIIIGIAFGLAVVELFGLGFSMALYCQIGKK
ncbi:tetraspanin-8 [Spea bombifrons]|uniref:tetraspanin-8 n=1 Tax=Spea bombifrons TaxID=233779 RepID=UPI00234904A2|nr:tetraspanin-8 [Spea bombifrons]